MTYPIANNIRSRSTDTKICMAFLFNFVCFNFMSSLLPPPFQEQAII